MIVHILNICKDGATKSAIMRRLSLSNSQLRRISAELVDKGFLQFREPDKYITANKGYEFLWLNSKDNNKQQDSENGKT